MTLIHSEIRRDSVQAADLVSVSDFDAEPPPDDELILLDEDTADAVALTEAHRRGDTAEYAYLLAVLNHEHKLPRVITAFSKVLAEIADDGDVTPVALRRAVRRLAEKRS